MAKSLEDTRKANNARKKKERQLKNDHLKAVGAQKLDMTIYSGTRAALDQLKQIHDFEEGRAGDEELLTYLIHNTVNRGLLEQRVLLAVPKKTS